MTGLSGEVIRWPDVFIGPYLSDLVHVIHRLKWNIDMTMVKR